MRGDLYLSTLKAILLGAIQGLTEFLPVSSSGHLVLFRNILNFHDGLLTFEVLLHFGTALAVIIVFWQDIKKLFNFKDPQQRHFLMLLIVGTIPAGLMGIFLEDYIESLFSSTALVGLMLIVTGLILFFSSKFYKGDKGITDIRFVDALIIGIAQGIAIIPGISRSGMTIVAALSRRINRELAAKYSFILSLPVILGAGVYRSRLLFSSTTAGNFLPLLLGTLAALTVGYFAIKILNKLIIQGRLHYFSYYCWFVGLVVILRHFI